MEASERPGPEVFWRGNLKGLRRCRTRRDGGEWILELACNFDSRRSVRRRGTPRPPPSALKPSDSATVPILSSRGAERAFIIEAEGLGKAYGSQRALTDVTLRVPPGTVGLLGPNGAGKSTFIKCLLNLTTPTSGTAKVLGRDIRAQHRNSREKVGYSPEQDCHIPGMAGCEYVTYCGQLSGMSFRQARQRAHEKIGSAYSRQRV